jgi:CPA2 family monovalent cation:H+ antiporter-2
VPQDALLRELILTFALALALIVGLARLRVPPIVALIATGTLAGPTGIGIVRTQEDVQTLAEIGVVLLLFTVGLDFSLADFRRMWKRVAGAGVLQIAITTVVVLLVAVATGRSLRVSLFIGLFVALSSTAIVLKELTSRNQLDTPHGRLTVGVLLFQDLSVVALLLLVPLMSGQTELTQVPLALGRALLAIVIVVAISRFVLPWLLGTVARSGRREAFSLAVVVASVGTAWVSSLLGISMALGAFLGGLVLAESEFSHQAHAEIRPVRDLLAGLFFISLGMLVDVPVVMRQLPWIAALALVIVAMKAVGAAGSLLLVATPLRVAVVAGIGLAQIGEFSFIFGRSGLDAGLLTPGDWQTLLAASIVTMLVTPAMIGVAPRIGLRAARLSTRADVPDADGSRLADHVVVLGFGIGGQLVARALKELGTPYLVLELNGAAVRRARARGEPIVFGDATSPDALAAAGLARARALVSVLSDPDASLLAVRAARTLSSAVPIIARVRYRTEADALLKLGATIAVAEEFEASLEVLTQLLARLEVPGNAVEMLLESLRRATLGQRPVRAASRPLEDLAGEIGDIPIATHELQDGQWAVGRSLADVNLRAQTGALIIAIRRGSANIPSPPADLRLQPGDVLYLMGGGENVAGARRHLQVGG